jgi:hypothetical protein
MRRRAITGALLLIGVGVVLGATVFRTDIAKAAGLAQSVTVVNTPANPVPVKEQNRDGNGNIKVHEQGTANVNVTGTPTVNAAQQGAWNVGIVGTPAVNVETPVFIQRLGFIHINPGNDVGTTPLYTVPDGKRLIVTYLNAEVDTAPGAHVLISLASAQFAIDHFLTMTDQGEVNATEHFVGGQLVSFSYGPGNDLYGQLLRGPNTIGANAEVGFTGYLVDAT